MSLNYEFMTLTCAEVLTTMNARPGAFLLSNIYLYYGTVENAEIVAKNMYYLSECCDSNIKPDESIKEDVKKYMNDYLESEFQTMKTHYLEEVSKLKNWSYLKC